MITAPPPGAHWQRYREHEAAGDEDAALTALARGTQARDPYCARELGYRLLVGDRMPQRPQDGLRFLGEACDLGLPESAARAAAQLALGQGFAPDWRLALAWLVRAAQGGWPAAREQLRALADGDARAEALRDGHGDDWAALAAALPLAKWWQPAEVTRLHEDPTLVRVGGLLTPRQCRLFIDLSTGLLEPAKVYDPVALTDIVDAHRSNTLAKFDQRRVEFVHLLLQQRIAATVGLPERHLEPVNVLHYAPGEQIRNHYDFVDPKSTPDYAGEIARNGQRLVTFLAYLNEDYSGGETDFPTLGITHRGVRGDGLFFVNALPDLQPDLRTLHAGRPPASGEKWIVTQFIRNRPTR
ncbi:MAG: hypothetical protein RL026_1658 [Pseudomonadota bacterium]